MSELAKSLIEQAQNLEKLAKVKACHICHEFDADAVDMELEGGLVAICTNCQEND